MTTRSPSPGRIATYAVLWAWAAVCAFPIYWLAIASITPVADLARAPGYVPFLDFTPMPAIGADAFPIAFGNWQAAYYVVDRPGVRFMRDPYTSKPNVLFYAYRRIGGGLANSEAVKLLKIST